MMPETRCVPSHRRALFAVLGCLLALGGWLMPTPGASVSAASLHVTSCLDDGGAGTLRALIGSAAPGATIDFSQNCTGATAITLAAAKGTLTLAQGVTIDGTGHSVTVDGGLHRRL